jgi:hypothetical protein
VCARVPTGAPQDVNAGVVLLGRGAGDAKPSCAAAARQLGYRRSPGSWPPPAKCKPAARPWGALGGGVSAFIAADVTYELSRRAERGAVRDSGPF